MGSFQTLEVSDVSKILGASTATLELNQIVEADNFDGDVVELER